MIFAFIALMIASADSLTEVYSVDQQFVVRTQPLPDELAHVRYLPNYERTGWDQLYIYASPKASPLQQHQAVGFLEGYATYARINAAYHNFVKLDFAGQPYAPPDIRKFLTDQLAYMDYMVSTQKESIFWEYVGYYLEQLRFMHAGYQARVKKQGIPELTLDFQMLYYLSSVGDLEDFIHFSPEDSQYRKNCNAYIKLDGEQLYTTHATHNRYSFLLRTYKFWNFPRANVPMQFTSFTSRPGDMISKDDFFVLGSGLRVLETSLQNKIPENIEQVKSTTVPSWLRTLVANHLSRSADEWISYFLMWRSGTHNNQWVLIDPSNIGKKQGLVVFFEEAFSLFHKIDMTASLYDKGYVASYNTPISKDIYDKLGYSEPDDPTYPNQLRAKILEAYHPKMTSIEAMKYWLINNQEPLPKRGLAPRYDLMQDNPKPFGLTDCKIASEDTIRDNFLWAQSGPSRSNGRFAPFDWRKWHDSTTPRQGLAMTYDFEWTKIEIDLQASKERSRLTNSQESS